MSRWCPRSTVATLVYAQEHFLLVEEYDRLSHPHQTVLNQPAGHLEPGESLVAAAERETLEETGWKVKVNAYLGLYINVAPNQVTYHRHCFIAQPLAALADAQLDEGILGPRWMTFAQILLAEQEGRLRSPMVRPCCEDFLAGQHFPLDMIRDFRTETPPDLREKPLN